LPDDAPDASDKPCFVCLDVSHDTPLQYRDSKGKMGTRSFRERLNAGALGAALRRPNHIAPEAPHKKLGPGHRSGCKRRPR
jgi:hypothetical protein